MKLYVQKKGYNQNQQYKYATEGDILECLKKAFTEVGLIYTMSLSGAPTGRETITAKGTKQWVTDIIIKFSLIDPESGETVELLFPGSGIDTGDKGLYKALTGCQKYFLAKNFMIETGNDPEANDNNRTSGHKRRTNIPDKVVTEIMNRFTPPLPPRSEAVMNDAAKKSIADKGQKAPPPPVTKYITAAHVTLLTSVLKNKALTPADLCEGFGIANISKLPATELGKALKWTP